MHRTGHRPDPPEVVARRKGLHLLRHPGFLAAKSATLPTATNNSRLFQTRMGGPGVLAQGRTGTCEGFAHAGGATLRLALAGTPVPLISPIAAYQLAFVATRQPDASGNLPPIDDNGQEPSNVLAGMSEYGACSAAQYGLYPADPGTITQEPDLTKLEACQVARLDGAYFVTSTGPQMLTDIATALAAGFPVSIALPASGPDFQGYTGGVLTQAQLTGDVDHANYILDLLSWDGKDLASAIWLCVNSWNTTWGEAGLWRCDSTAVAAFQDCAALNLTRTT